MSNGMRQRVGIARAFALSPKLLLLDEPFGMLDSLTRWELQEVLMEVWSRTKVTAVCVTHDVDEAILLADRVVMMTNGPQRHDRQDHRGQPAPPPQPPRPAEPPRLLQLPRRNHGVPGRIRAWRNKEGCRMMAQKLVVIGAGMASGRMLETAARGGSRRL